MTLQQIIDRWERRAEKLCAKADLMEDQCTFTIMDEGTYQKQCRLYREAATIAMIVHDLKGLK